MIAKWVILPQLLLLATSLGAPDSRRQSDQLDTSDYEGDEEPFDPAGIKTKVNPPAKTSHTEAEATDDGEYDGNVTPNEGRAVGIKHKINHSADFRHRTVPHAGNKQRKYADAKEFQYNEAHADAEQQEKVHPVEFNNHAAIRDKVIHPVGITHKNTAEEFHEQVVTSKANKDGAGNGNLKFRKLAAIRNKIIHLDGAHHNVYNADPESQDEYEGESSGQNENRGSSAMKHNFKVIQHTSIAESTTPGQGEVNEPTEPSSTPAFEAFYPREAYGIPNSVARAPHGHATFYKYRNPALVDTHNAAAYGFRFDGKRRFNYD